MPPYFFPLIAAGSLFNMWEVNDARGLVRMQLQNATAHQRLADTLHRTAFRTGLGNSVLMPASQVGRISSSTLVAFFVFDFCQFKKYWMPEHDRERERERGGGGGGGKLKFFFFFFFFFFFLPLPPLFF